MLRMEGTQEFFFEEETEALRGEVNGLTISSP